MLYVPNLDILLLLPLVCAASILADLQGKAHLESQRWGRVCQFYNAKFQNYFPHFTCTLNIVHSRCWLCWISAVGQKKKKNYIETQLFYFLVHRYKVFNFIFKFLHLILPVSSILCFWYWCKSSHPNTDWSHDDQRKGIILIYQFYRLITYASRTSCSVWRTWKLSENVAVTLQCLVGQNLSSDLSRAAFVSWALCWVCLILGAVPAPLSGDPPLWHHSATHNHSGFWNCKLKTGEKSIYEFFFFPTISRCCLCRSISHFAHSF